MAFGYNQPQSYGETISTVADAQRNTQFQTALQERFDVNNAKLDEAIMKVSSIPLLREKDQEYLKQKLSNVLNEVNGNLKASGGRTLLNNNLSGHLTKLIGSSIDDYLVGQMGIAQQKQAFDANLSKLQEKNPEKFSSTNYAYALEKAGWGDYLNGKSDNLKGGLVYSPFSDYMTNAMKKVKELIDIKGDYVIEQPDGKGGVNKISLKGLSAQELTQYAPMFLSEQDRQQIAIDGWALGKQDPEGTKNIYKNLVQSNIQSLQDDLTATEAKINDTTLSAEERTKAEGRKKALQEQISVYESQKDTQDLELMGYAVKKQEVDSMFMSAFVGRTQTTYDKDDAYFSNLELQKAVKEQEASAGTIMPQGSVIATVQEEQDVTGVNAYTSVKQAHDKAYNTMIGTGLAVLEDSTIGEDKKAEIRSSLKAQGFLVKTQPDGSIDIINDPSWKGQKLSKALAVNEALISSGALTTQQEIELKKAYNTKTNLAVALKEANKSFGKDVNTDDLVDDAVTFAKALSGTGVEGFMEKLAQTFDPKEWMSGNTPNSIAPTEKDLERIAVASKIGNLISSNGGEKSFRQKIKTDPALAQKLVNLLEESADVGSGIFSGDFDGGKITRNLNQAGERLKQLGALPYTKDKYNIQVVDEKARERLLNTIDQTLPTQGEAFDSKRPITVVAEYNSRGAVESFIITQQSGKTDKDGVSKPSSTVKVSASSATGQIIKSTVAQTENLDAMQAPNTTRITPVKLKVSNPFPSSLPDTDREYDNLVSVLGNTAPNTVAGMILNPNTKRSSRDNAIIYMKSQLSDKYSDEEINQIYNQVESGVKNGNFSSTLVPNKMPSQGTAKWVLDIKYQGNPIIKANYTSTAVMPSAKENYFLAYPQFVILEQIVEQYKNGNRIF